MRNLLYFLPIAFTSIIVRANPVDILPRFSNSYRFTTTDVWNVDVQYNGASTVGAYMLANISLQGKAVIVIKSNSFTLAPGIQSFTPVTLGTNTIDFMSQAIADIENLTGTYPSGEYKVCYSIFCVTQDCDGLGSGTLYSEQPQCIDFIVEPPTPLLLAFPEDQSEISWPRPTFNWIPPMPMSNVNGFQYLFTLVQSEKGQSCMDAMVRNRPLYKQTGIEFPVLPFPGEINDLDTGIKYCWKVDGLVNEIPIAQSEVWEFRLKKEEIKDSISPVYFDCRREYQSTFELTERIGLIFFEKKRNSTIHISISNVDGNKIIFEGDYETTYGENKYILEFSEIPGIRTKEKYLIHVSDHTLKTLSIGFEVVKK